MLSTNKIDRFYFNFFFSYYDVLKVFCQGLHGVVDFPCKTYLLKRGAVNRNCAFRCFPGHRETLPYVCNNLGLRDQLAEEEVHPKTVLETFTVRAAWFTWSDQDSNPEPLRSKPRVKERIFHHVTMAPHFPSVSSPVIITFTHTDQLQQV